MQTEQGQIEPKQIESIEYDESGQNRPNMTEMDKIGRMWIEQSQCGLNKTEWTEYNFSKHNGLNWIKLDQIEPMQTE